jgi:hypothetical protein
LLESDPTNIRPTALGRRFLNDLQSLFLADARERRGAATLVRHDPVRDGH